MNRIREFLSVYRAYRTVHSPVYAARIAWGVTFQQLPF